MMRWTASDAEKNTMNIIIARRAHCARGTASTMPPRVPLPDPPVQPPRVAVPSSNNAPQLNVAKLNGAVSAIEDLKLDLRKSREEAEKREKVLYGTIKVLQARLAAAEARVSGLIEYMELEEEGDDDDDEETRDGGGRNGAVAAEDGGAQQAPETGVTNIAGQGSRGQGPTAEQIRRSEETVKNASIKVCKSRIMPVQQLTSAASVHGLSASHQ